MKKIKASIFLVLLIVVATAVKASEQQTEKTHVEKLDDQYIRYMIAQAEQVGIARKEKCEASVFCQGTMAYVRMTCPKSSIWGKSSHDTLHKLYEQQMATYKAYLGVTGLIKEQARLNQIKVRLTERGSLNALDAQELDCPKDFTMQQVEQELEKVTSTLNGLKNSRGSWEAPLMPEIFSGFFSSEYRGGRGMGKTEYNKIAQELREQDKAEQAKLKSLLHANSNTNSIATCKSSDKA